MENARRCEINARGFALAAGGVMGAVYTVCAVFVALFPTFSLRLLGWLVHLVNVERFAKDVAITATSFLAGLAEVTVYSFVIAWLLARLHNQFGEKK
ncbi:MAG: hypothetical protein HY536_00920 [Candidatus Colwellbacteria bacterium]|nr:hypothetical protein [Candidatus Colwellbacteria bacterium]